MAKKRLHWYVRRDRDGAFTSEGLYDGETSETLADLQARMPVGHTVLDADTSPRPPATPGPPDPLRGEYAASVTDLQKLDVIAKRLGLR